MAHNVELVGNWNATDIAYANGKHGVSNDYADRFAGFAIQSLPSSDIALRTIQSQAIVSKTERSFAAIDNGPIVTKAGIRRGNNGIAMRTIGKISRHNPNTKGIVSASDILLQRANAKKANALAIPEQVGAMIRKCSELQISIEKKLAKGHDATNLIKCLEVTQARVRFLLDHCEEKGLLLIHPMKTGKAKGSLAK